MAIKLKRATSFSDLVDAEYWRIGVANIHPRNNSCQIVLDGYVNKAARDGGKTIISSIEMPIPWSAFSNGNNPNLRDIYTYVKTLEDWSAGEEV